MAVSLTEEKTPLVIIAGPTASGKSAAAVQLALRMNGAVVSADSMQVYRGMDIGTAKVTREEMCGVAHYLIDCADACHNTCAIRTTQSLANVNMNWLQTAFVHYFSRFTPFALVMNPAFTDQAESDVCQLNKVATRTHTAVFGNERIDAAVNELGQ